MRNKSFALVAVLALAAMVSACAGSPTSPSCTTVASCQAQNPAPTGVPPSVVATVSPGVSLGANPPFTPVSVNADGSFTVKINQRFQAGFSVFNPRAEGRMLSYTMPPPAGTGYSPSSDSFLEPTRDSNVGTGSSLMLDSPGDIVLTLSGSETGGNLPSPNMLASQLVIHVVQ